jgi:hypothetical protein
MISQSRKDVHQIPLVIEIVSVKAVVLVVQDMMSTLVGIQSFENMRSKFSGFK